MTLRLKERSAPLPQRATQALQADPAQAGVGKPRRKRRRKPQTSEADQ